MKKLILFLTLLCSFAHAANPDILVYSRTTTKWNVFLLDKFQVFMKNLNLNVDPYMYYHDQDINYDESSINDFVSSDVSLFIADIEKASGLSILNLHPELTLSGFGYSIEKILPTIEPSEVRGNVQLSSNIKLEGIGAFAKELKLSFLISSLVEHEKISALDVSIINPKIIIRDSDKLSFDLDLLLEEGNNETKLRFTKANFDEITNALNDNENLIDIVYDSVQIPDVELNLMGRNITVNSNKVREIIEMNKQKIKKLFVGQIKTLFEKNGALEVLKHFDGTSFKNDRWILPTSDSVFPMYLGVKDYSVPFKDVVQVELGGDFCTTINYERHQADCVNNRVTIPAKPITTKAQRVYSAQDVEDSFKDDKDIMLVASISEDYINKALATTVDFGLWDPMLEQVGLKLGDKSVQVRFNKKSNTASLFLDVVYEVEGLTGFITREKKIRFPVVLDVKVRVENEEQLTFDEVTGEWTKGDIPFVVFNIFDVDLNDNYFNYGIEEYELPTSISNVRKIVRKKVIKTIKKELLDYDAPKDKMTLLKWKGTDVPPVELPEIKGLSLDTVETRSDGHGRLNVIMRDSKIFN